MRCALLPRIGLLTGLLAVPLLFAVVSSATAAEPFVLIDKNGKVIGPILDMRGGDNGTVRVPFRVGNQRIMLGVWSDNFSGKGFLYFESTNCFGGQPYLIASGGLLTDAVVDRDRTLYVPDGPTRIVALRSSYNIVEGDCSSFAEDPTLVRAAREVVDLNTHFTPPFRVLASPEVIDLDAPAP